MKLKRHTSIYWRWLSGAATDFATTDRIFHSVCLISIAALLYNVPLNYMIGLPLIGLASLGASLLFAGIYHLARFKRRTTLARLVFCIMGNLLFVANFFLNSGIDGPTDIFFILTMIMMVAIVPVGQYWYWVVTNLVLVLGLHFLQFLKPNWAQFSYLSLKDRFVDISSAYVTVVGVTVLSFYLIRRSYEKEKQSAEQKTGMLRVLNDEKNKLFSIIAHDLRSPLANIQSYLELLVDMDISKEEAKNITQSLLAATRSTLDMLNNVLNWTKNQMDGSTPEFGSVIVYKRLSPQLKLFMDIAANKSVTLEVSIDPGIEIWGNGDMLQLIVRNLVNNAIKFTIAGGKVVVGTSRENGNCLITVKDSGTGNPVMLSSEIFYLSSDTKMGTRGEKGVGLGLVLCKEYVEAQNGNIWFECDAISGTTFFVQLPMTG